MLILEDLSAEIRDTNAFHWDLKSLSRDDGGPVLFYGYNAAVNPVLLARTKHRRRLLFNNWAPCEFAQEFSHPGQRPLDYEAPFADVFTICPYTAAWLNGLGLGRTYHEVFYPWNPNLIPDHVPKVHDVIYHGGIHGVEHSDALKAMTRFNYRYCSMTHGINGYTAKHLGFATDLDLSFRDKIALIARTKVSICYNLVHVMPDQVPRILKYGKGNDAFASVGTWNVMPQFKTRMHEAAFSRTLNLVRRDLWNVAARWYEPDREYLTFDDERDLSVKLRAILSDWDTPRVQGILDAAYAKSLKYTTPVFVETLAAETSKP